MGWEGWVRNNFFISVHFKMQKLPGGAEVIGAKFYEHAYIDLDRVPPVNRV